MDQLSAEKRLTLSYLVIVIAGGTASITSGIAWGHWYRTLDVCVDRNCSCILYGQQTPSQFWGGPQAPCIWVTFGPLVYVFFALCFTCFHGYRVLFTTKSPRTRSARTLIAKTGPGETVQIQAVSQEDTSPLPRAFWMTMSILSVIFLIYSLVHFSVFVDGFYRTCNQFRHKLEVMLRLDGTALPVIYQRLYCQGIFDFMDYMHMDEVNTYKNGFINTGLDLIIGIVASGFAWFSFFMASLLNFYLARKVIEED